MAVTLYPYPPTDVVSEPSQTSCRFLILCQMGFCRVGRESILSICDTLMLCSYNMTNFLMSCAIFAY